MFETGLLALAFLCVVIPMGIALAAVSRRLNKHTRPHGKYWGMCQDQQDQINKMIAVQVKQQTCEHKYRDYSRNTGDEHISSTCKDCGALGEIWNLHDESKPVRMGILVSGIFLRTAVLKTLKRGDLTDCDLKVLESIGHADCKSFPLPRKVKS